MAFYSLIIRAVAVANWDELTFDMQAGNGTSRWEGMHKPCGLKLSSTSLQASSGRDYSLGVSDFTGLEDIDISQRLQ
jgi:hypothetical protein